MDPVTRAVLLSWDFRPEVIVPLALLGMLFIIGRRRLRTRSREVGRTGWRSLGAGWRPVSYIAGLVTIAFALLSPFEVLVQQLFFMHMIQHMLLIMIAPLLIWLPNPVPFLLWGLPDVARLRIGNGLNAAINKRSWSGQALRKITSPLIIWFIYVIVIVGWHDPSLYNAALTYPTVHDLEHLTMFAAGMLFWWTVTGAGPRLHKALSRPAKVVFIISIIPVNMALGVVLAFANYPIYSYYESAPRLWGISVLTDQRISGIIMWIPGNMMLFMVALFIVLLILSREQTKPPAQLDTWMSDQALAAPGTAAAALPATSKR